MVQFVLSRPSGKIQYNPLFFRQFSGKIQAKFTVRFVLGPIDSLKQKDTLTHYLSDHYEFYLWIKDEDAQQVDPIFVLGNAKEGHDFARSLHWEYENAYYNRYPEE